MSQQPIHIPDLGDTKEATLIEILVAVGDTVSVDDPLITLEGDKATMEVPSPIAGTITSIDVKVGDALGSGATIMHADASDKQDKTKAASADEDNASKPDDDSSDEPTTANSETHTDKAQTTAPSPKAEHSPSSSETSTTKASQPAASGEIYAGPSVRKLARALDIDLAHIQGTGRKGRITPDDLHQHLKTRLQHSGGSSGLTMPSAPVVDFSQFGETETVSFNKIKRLTGSHVHTSWVTVPHVTQFDEADITDMEAFRKAQKDAAAKQGIKLTPIVFVMKALVAALKAFPHFNASLSPNGDAMILKKYFNIGVAVDTPNGLVVPVIRAVEQKSLFELSEELVAISQKAREKGLSPADMQGGCMTISSLGGIGGTAFTPIVNIPEVAILGLSKASMKPVYIDGSFQPRLMLPMSLSYDHRMIDGADGARFTQFMVRTLGDIRTLLL